METDAMKWTEEREKLLEKAVKENDGKLKMSKAFRIYHREKDAKEAVKKLEEFGYVERIDTGVFRVKKLPDQLEHLEIEASKDEDGFMRRFLQGMFTRF